MLNVGRADAIIIEVLDDLSDKVIFLDTGFEHNYDHVKNYFELHIRPNLVDEFKITLIVTHPHKDHIGGVFNLIRDYSDYIEVCYFNNFYSFFSATDIEAIYDYTPHDDFGVIKISKLIESIEYSKNLVEILGKHKILLEPLLSDYIPISGQSFKVLSPSSTYYLSLIEKIKRQIADDSYAIERPAKPDHDDDPCNMIDQVIETNLVNMTSSIISFNDLRNNNYFFTSDCSTHSFDDALHNGFTFDNCVLLQLPHHGCRRNISSKLIKLIDPQIIWVSTNGKKLKTWIDTIACIKKSLIDIDLKITCHDEDLSLNTKVTI